MGPMPIDDDTQATVRALWAAGVAHDRAPAPVPESDPWQEADQGADPDLTIVSFPGTPEVEVRLHADGDDTVLVETSADFDVPRTDVVLLVTELLAGRVRRRPRVRGTIGNLMAALLGSPAPADAEIRVGDRVYSTPITARQPLSTWLMSRPLADE